MSWVKQTALLGAWAISCASAAPSSSSASSSISTKLLSRAATDNSTSSSSIRSSKVTSNGCTYAVTGLGSFTEAVDLDFTALKSLPSSLSVSTNTIAAGTAPFSRRFMLKNVAVDKSGYVTLTVPGGQQADPILSAEIQTSAKDILYASVRTVAMASTIQGTTHGFSFYSNDTQEADIAFLTDDSTLLHLTNEQTGYGQPVTTYSVTAPADAAAAWHEYRMDWIPGKTMFYIDGQLVYQINVNVPMTPGFFLWNNWSNGNSWAKGPPPSTNTVKIQSITAYFNRTSVSPNTKSTACQNAAASWTKQTQSCKSISSLSTAYNDVNGVQYTVQCAQQLVNGNQIDTKPQSSFASCIASCDRVRRCGGIMFDGGDGGGTCTYVDITGAGTIDNDGFDIATLSSIWNSTSTSSQ